MRTPRSSESSTSLVQADRVPEPPGEVPALRGWADELVARARADGVELTGKGRLLTDLVRQVLHTGLDVELGEHLGYERYDPAGRGSGNSRNGAYPKSVTTEIGEVELRMPRATPARPSPPQIQRFSSRPAWISRRGRSSRHRSPARPRRCLRSRAALRGRTRADPAGRCGRAGSPMDAPRRREAGLASAVHDPVRPARLVRPVPDHDWSGRHSRASASLTRVRRFA